MNHCAPHDQRLISRIVLRAGFFISVQFKHTVALRLIQVTSSWREWMAHLPFLSGGADSVSERNRNIIDTYFIVPTALVSPNREIAISQCWRSIWKSRRKPKQNLDAVVGPSRLPVFEDRPFRQRIAAPASSNASWWAFFVIMVTAILKASPHGYWRRWIMMVIIFRKGWLWWLMHGQYEWLPLLSVQTFLIRSILLDPEVFSDLMGYRPVRFLKDGKLNPDVMESRSVAFGFERRSVDPTYSATYTS